MTEPSFSQEPAPTIFSAWHYLLATAPFVVVFLIMPCELFFNQTEEWDLTLGQLAILPLIGLLGVLATWMLLAGLAKWHKRLARGAALLLFALGCFLLLADIYSPLQIEHLDGGVLTSDEPLKYTLLEAAIGLVFLCILFLILRGRGERIAVGLAACIALIGIGYAGVVLVHLLTPEPVITRAEADTKSSSGNVYHIVLDRMQTDAFLEAVDYAEARQAFRGFQLYRNNVSNYLNTVTSRASYLTGTFYHAGDYRDWFRGVWRERGIQKLLSDQDYRVWNYAAFRQWDDEAIDVFYYIRDIYHERTGIPYSDFADFVTLWLLRPVPNPLTEETLPIARTAGELLLAGLSSPDGTDPVSQDQSESLTLEEGIQAVASKYMLEQLTADEVLRGATGEYVYAHAVLPHVPYVLDSTCTYQGNSNKSGRRQAYLDQSVCSVGLLKDFLIQLQALDRYDSATIVVHSDTGAEEGFLADPPGYRSTSATLGRPDNELLSGINALLMIKRPHQSGPLQETDQLTQLVDLFPTLMDILDLEELIDYPIHGRSIYADRKERREVRLGFDPDEQFGPNLIEVRIDTPEDLHRSPLTVIGPALEPAHWRKEILHAK